MKRNLLFLAIFSLLSTTIHAQTIDKKLYDKFKVGTKEIVFVCPNSDDVTGTDWFKKILKDYWAFSVDYKVIDSAEAAPKLKDTDDEDVIILFSAGYTTDIQKPSKTKSAFTNPGKLVMQQGGKEIASVLTESIVNDMDIVGSLKIMQYELKNRMQFKSINIQKEAAKLNGSQLKEKTLLVPIKFADGLTIDEIKAVYPFKVELAELSVISEKVLANSEDYLVMHLGRHLWADNTTSSVKIVYSPSDGTIVTFSVKKLSVFVSGSSAKIETKDFTRFIKAAGLK